MDKATRHWLASSFVSVLQEAYELSFWAVIISRPDEEGSSFKLTHMVWDVFILTVWALGSTSFFTHYWSKIQVVSAFATWTSTIIWHLVLSKGASQEDNRKRGRKERRGWMSPWYCQDFWYLFQTFFKDITCFSTVIDVVQRDCRLSSSSVLQICFLMS